MLQALAHDAQGHRPQALESLAQAWALAPEPDGYVRLFLDEGAPMIDVAPSTPSRWASTAGHARRLLSTRPPPATPAATDRWAESGARRLAELVERAGAPGAQAARQRADRPADRPRAVRLPNTLRTHTKHIFTKLERHQPPGGGPPRTRARA